MEGEGYQEGKLLVVLFDVFAQDRVHSFGCMFAPFFSAFLSFLERGRELTMTPSQNVHKRTYPESSYTYYLHIHMSCCTVLNAGAPHLYTKEHDKDKGVL